MPNVVLKIEISPDEFKAIPSTDEKLNVIYSALLVQQKHCSVVCDTNDKRFIKLEKRKIKDSGLAALMGALTGFLAGLVKTS